MEGPVTKAGRRYNKHSAPSVGVNKRMALRNTTTIEKGITLMFWRQDRNGDFAGDRS